jgi:hypothetical protein
MVRFATPTTPTETDKTLSAKPGAAHRSWKSGPGANLPFKNELVALSGGRAPGSDHFERRFAEANAQYMNRLLESGVTADDVLQHAKQGKPRVQSA